MRSSHRKQILDHALDVLRAGETLTLDSAAGQAAITKPGLMYHFSTKEALLLALVDHIIDRYETELVDVAGAHAELLPPAQRLLAYLHWNLNASFDAADLVIFSDPNFREVMTQRWTERMGAWISVPAAMPAPERASLEAVRLLADGSWFADASGMSPLPLDDRPHVYRLATTILGNP